MFCIQGCAANGYWYKDGASENEFAKVKYVCLNEPMPENAIADGYKDYGKLQAKNHGERLNNMTMSAIGDGMKMASATAYFKACMNAYGYYWRNEK